MSTPPALKRKAEDDAGDDDVPLVVPKQEISGAELLQCTMCRQVAASPINSCPNGHIVCGICVDKLARTRKCQTCSKGRLQVNPALELQAQKVEVKLECPNSSSGCTELVLSTGMKDHLKNSCYFRDIRCNFGQCADNITLIPFSQYIAHLAEQHVPIPSITMGDTPENLGRWTRLGCFDVSEKDLKQGNRFHRTWATRPIIWGGQTFLFHLVVKQGTLYSWVTMMGSPSQAKEAHVRFTLTIKDQRCPKEGFGCFALPVVAFYDHPDSKPGDYLALTVPWTSVGLLFENLESPNNAVQYSLILDRNN